jgi:hypothetical protein
MLGAGDKKVEWESKSGPRGSTGASGNEEKSMTGSSFSASRWGLIMVFFFLGLLPRKWGFLRGYK